MRVFVDKFFYPSAPRDWNTFSFLGQQIQFDPKSKSDEKLFGIVLERDAVNKKCGTVISMGDDSDIPRCRKCGALPVRYYFALGCVYGVVCPVCGTPTPDLPDNLKRCGGRS